MRSVVSLAALELCILTLALLSSPAAGPYPSYAGFASAGSAAVALVVLLLVSARRPAVLRAAAAPWTSLGSFVVGLCLIGYGCGEHSSAAVLSGWLLAQLGMAWLVLLAGSLLARMDAPTCLRAVFASFSAVFVLGGLMVPLLSGLVSARAALLAVALVAYAVSFFAALRPGMAALAAFVEARSTASETRSACRADRRFGSSVLFAALFALGVVSGYASFAVFGVRGGAGLNYGALVAAVLACAAASRFSKNRIDVVFHTGLLLVLAGLLVVPFVGQAHAGGAVALSHTSNTLLMAGAECFSMLVWAVIARRGSRRPERALVVLAGGRLAAAAGALVGLVVGTSARSLSAVSPLAPDAVAVFLAFVLVAYCLIGLRSFSFEESVEGEAHEPEGEAVPERADAAVPAEAPGAVSAPAPAQSALAPAPSPALDPAAAVERRCERLASLRGLTSREAEVLKLMACGRSGSYIAECLVISPNTVKTHVKHIYAKLDAHSQQDVVDLVFETEAS